MSAQRVITYAWAYVAGEIDLCRACANDDDAGGVLGPVQHGEHEGTCEACVHPMPRYSPDTQADLRADYILQCTKDEPDR